MAKLHLCERCKEVETKRGNKFCSDCGSAVRGEMERSGYMTKLAPRIRPRNPDNRQTVSDNQEEGNPSVENAVRHFEDGKQ
jgi:hypothetical protein